MGKFDHQLPLDGEIVDAPSPAGEARSAGRKLDIVDAEFEEVGLPILTSEEITRHTQRNSSGAAVLSSDGMSMLKRESVESVRQKGSVLFYFGAAAIVFMAFWISGGYAIFPSFGKKTAVADADMRIDNITTSTVTLNEHPLLLVRGTVVNSGDGRAEPPPVKITVKSKSGDVVSYQLGSKGWPLGPGQTMPFSSRLDAPASGVESVRVGLSGKGMR
jgi:hypothetical protein